MILDLCYHPYYPCLYAFWYSIPTFFSIFCNCFLYLCNIYCVFYIPFGFTANRVTNFNLIKVQLNLQRTRIRLEELRILIYRNSLLAGFRVDYVSSSPMIQQLLIIINYIIMSSANTHVCRDENHVHTYLFTNKIHS